MQVWALEHLVLWGKGILSVNAAYEHGFGKNISAGASFGYVKTNYLVDWGYNNLVFGARGSYHFNELFKIENEKFDVYGGASVLYKYYKLIGSESSVKASGGDLDMAIHAGGRCLFTRKVGAFIELGYGLSPFQLGIVFKP
ncbi:hypothetical protein D3C80_718700 [compost metagenome]